MHQDLHSTHSHLNLRLYIGKSFGSDSILIGPPAWLEWCATCVAKARANANTPSGSSHVSSALCRVLAPAVERDVNPLQNRYGASYLIGCTLGKLQSCPTMASSHSRAHSAAEVIPACRDILPRPVSLANASPKAEEGEVRALGCAISLSAYQRACKVCAKTGGIKNPLNVASIGALVDRTMSIPHVSQRSSISLRAAIIV